MNFLEEKIAKDATVLNNDVLKVDNFINQQIDCNLMKKIAKDFANHFKDKKINKVVTIETSGISPALLTAIELNVPLVILKKQQSRILNTNI